MEKPILIDLIDTRIVIGHGVIIDFMDCSLFLKQMSNIKTSTFSRCQSDKRPWQREGTASFALLIA